MKLGWKVVLPKLPGFEGFTPKDVWDLNDYASFIYKLAQRKFGAKKFFVFGHSFGGAVSIKMASLQKEKLSGIILCSARGISRGKRFKLFIFKVLAKVGKLLLIKPQLANRFRILLYKLAREHDYEKTQGIMREVFKRVVSEDLKPILPRIKLPTLILWGEDDKMTPVKDAYYLKARIRKSKLIVYKSHGHRLPYEIPNVLGKDIDLWVRRRNI